MTSILTVLNGKKYGVDYVNKLYNKLQTPKKNRKEINSISFDLKYLSRNNNFKISNLKIDSFKLDQNLENINDVISNFFFDKQFTTIKFFDYKRLINDLITMN